MSGRDRALAWAERQLGWRPTGVMDVPGAHGTALVTRLRFDPTRVAFLKRHRQVRKYLQERAALERWAPPLDGTPRLLAARDAPPPALLLAAVPGSPVTVTSPRTTGCGTRSTASAWSTSSTREPTSRGSTSCA